MKSAYTRPGGMTDAEWARRKGLFALLCAAADILVLATEQLSPDDDDDEFRSAIDRARHEVLAAIAFVAKWRR